MQFRYFAATSAIACALAVTGCSRDTTHREANNTVTDSTINREANRVADAQRDRENDIAKMDERVAKLQRDYDEKAAAARPRGTSGSATAHLHDAVSDDMTGVKKAVDDLRTTTADNWWTRHEAALKTAANDIDADVRAFAGGRAAAPVRDRKVDITTDKAGEPVSNAPFASARDRFVADMQARVDGWKKTLDNAKAKGARETERDDLKARVNKLDEDLDKLKSASADDWWNLSKKRVDDYIDRVEKSVARLDDHK